MSNACQSSSLRYRNAYVPRWFLLYRVSRTNPKLHLAKNHFLDIADLLTVGHLSGLKEMGRQ